MEYNYKCVAPCLMGVERLVANELKFMGAQNVCADNGRVFFEGGAEIIARANIRCRVAERILLLCARFDARSFEELFNGVRSIDWGAFLPMNAQFPVTGSCLSSQLKSVSDCQGIIKKAAAEALKAKYGVKSMLPETGALYKIRFLILKDNVCIMLDTTGEPLHKRGYRANSGGAPMKETLAASLCQIAGVRKDHIVIDPCCGSGTILIEAALSALNIAPGINRSFVCEDWPIISQGIWENERNEAKKIVRTDCGFHGIGYDIDDEVLETARENAVKAGVDDRIEFRHRDIHEFSLDLPRATVICNPPYGERLLDISDAHEIYTAMGERFELRDGISYNIICPDDDFERCFKRRADKRRKLYNGMISCQLYMYGGRSKKK